MEYVKLTEETMDFVVRNYVQYYSTYEGGCRTYEKAYKRIQI